MENDSRLIMPGDRVKVFNGNVYIDDITTPLSITIQWATVIQRYGKKSGYYFDDNDVKTTCRYPDVIDVLFDGEELVSHGHFTNGVVEYEEMFILSR